MSRASINELILHFLQFLPQIRKPPILNQLEIIQLFVESPPNGALEIVGTGFDLLESLTLGLRDLRE